MEEVGSPAMVFWSSGCLLLEMLNPWRLPYMLHGENTNVSYRSVNQYILDMRGLLSYFYHAIHSVKGKATLALSKQLNLCRIKCNLLKLHYHIGFLLLSLFFM